MRVPVVLGVVLVVLGSAWVATGVAAVTPTRTLPQAQAVTPLGLTGRRVVFGVGVSPAECTVKLWSIAKRSVTRFANPKNPSCTVETSTGTGIAAVSVATSRVAWIAYIGGNIREWSLFTSRTPGARPLRLRFTARDVMGPQPIVLGQGTAQGIPYAVNRELVYLAEDGTRLFKVVAPDAISLVAAGPGPSGIRVVALTAGGSILAFSATGEAAADDIVPDGVVKALELIGAGVVYQVDNVAHIVGPAGDTPVELPPGATMVDAAAGRILYERAGSLGAVTIATGVDVPLVAGTRRQPVHGQLDVSGLAWAAGSTVNWRPGPLPAA